MWRCPNSTAASLRAPFPSRASRSFHAPTHFRIVTYKSVADRVEFVADLAANWIKLRHAEANRTVAIILANYPNKDGRIANGVGYDTPASTIAILGARGAGYAVGGLSATATRDRNAAWPHAPKLRLEASDVHEIALCLIIAEFRALPPPFNAVTTRWGESETDPFFRDGAFELRVSPSTMSLSRSSPRADTISILKSSYHDPALVPPHGYFAFYFWLRHVFGAHARDP